MLVKKLTAHRQIYSKNLNEPDGDGDYFDANTWEYLFSVWGNKRSDVHDIRRYRQYFLDREAKIIAKRWHTLYTDYNAEGVGVKVAPDIWENTYVLPGEAPEDQACTPGCNHCCCFNFGRIVIHKAEFEKLPSRRFHPFDDKCPWVCKGGCSVYKNRPFICRLWHCQGVEIGGDRAYKDYLSKCHKDGAVVINSGLRGLGCAESGHYGTNWKLL